MRENSVVLRLLGPVSRYLSRMKRVPASVGVLVVVLGAFACGGVDQSDALRSSRGTSSGGSSGASSSGSSGEPDDASTSSSSSSSSSSGGDGGGNDAGSDAPADAAGPANAFTGAGAFVMKTGPNTTKGDHGNGGNPAKQGCLQAACHAAGGEGPRWFAGGTVYKDKAATMPAAAVEVRLRDAAGHALITNTDNLGNFYVRAADATNAQLTFPLHVGVRDGATTKLMSATIANGDCNSAACHGGAQGFVYLQ